MITTALLEYIKNQNSKNVSRELIIARLAKAGWHIEDIEEGLAKAMPKIENKEENVSTSEIKKDYTIDPYHEPVDSSLEPLAAKIEQPKIEKEIKKEEPQKIWTPSAVKPVEEIEVKETSVEQPVIKPVSTRTLETFPTELDQPKEQIKTNYVKPIIKEIKTIVEETEAIPGLTPKPIQIPENEQVAKKKEEPLSWNFSPESKKESQPITLKSDVENIINPTIKETPEISNSEPIIQTLAGDTANNLSKVAMISSYSKDYMSANKLKQEVLKRRKNTLLKWLVVVLVICILGGVAFVFEKGYIKIPDINLPFVKKDPKTLLLDSANNLASLKSYKVETTAMISSPSLANITSGLMQGESINSNDRDSFSLNISGETSKIDPGSIFFDYDLKLSSSIVEKDIETNLKSNGNNYFIDIPDLKSVLTKDTPPEGVILIPVNQIDQTKKIFSSEIQKKINNIDIAKVLENINLNYLNNQSFSTSLKDLINGMKFIRKDEQIIKDINTYHYSVEVERTSLKKLLNDILGTTLTNLTETEKEDFEEKLGAISISSLDIWVGKKDGNIYQYKFTLTIPLSKIVGLEDKGIADNEVKLDWQTTYFDLNIPNNITMPTEFNNLENFLNNVNDTKTKSIISSFSQLAQIMKNALGNYGSKSNTTGSCTEPVPGSLFSPLGHSKGASTVVGTIASTMNTIVGQTNGVSSCYSTSKAWAIASPLSSDPNSYFCVDSAGNSVTITAPLTKTVCQ
jgi:hypothetical protein